MNLSDAASLSDRCTGDGMVEVLEFVIPRDTLIMESKVLQSLIDRSEVLETTLRSNKVMSRGKYSSVVQTDTEGIPLLLDFRVGVASAVIFGINIFHNWNINFWLSENKLILEDNLKIGVEALVVYIVFRSASSV